MQFYKASGIHVLHNVIATSAQITVHRLRARPAAQLWLSTRSKGQQPPIVKPRVRVTALHDLKRLTCQTRLFAPQMISDCSKYMHAIVTAQHTLHRPSTLCLSALLHPFKLGWIKLLPTHTPFYY